MATRPDTRLVRARLLLLLGCLSFGVGVGLLLTGSVFAGIAAVAAALLMSGGGFSMGVHPRGTLVRRMRQAPALGLVLVGVATTVADVAPETVLCLLLGVGLLVVDSALVRRAAGAPKGWSVPRPRSVVPVEESRRAADAYAATGHADGENLDPEGSDVDGSDSEGLGPEGRDQESLDAADPDGPASEHVSTARDGGPDQTLTMTVAREDSGAPSESLTGPIQLTDDVAVERSA